jgi:hypothetical protein
MKHLCVRTSQPFEKLHVFMIATVASDFLLGLTAQGIMYPPQQRTYPLTHERLAACAARKGTAACERVDRWQLALLALSLPHRCPSRGQCRLCATVW